MSEAFWGLENQSRSSTCTGHTDTQVFLLMAHTDHRLFSCVETKASRWLVQVQEICGPRVDTQYNA